MEAVMKSKRSKKDNRVCTLRSDDLVFDGAHIATGIAYVNFALLPHAIRSANNEGCSSYNFIGEVCRRLVSEARPMVDMDPSTAIHSSLLQDVVIRQIVGYAVGAASSPVDMVPIRGGTAVRMQVSPRYPVDGQICEHVGMKERKTVIAVRPKREIEFMDPITREEAQAGEPDRARMFLNSQKNASGRNRTKITIQPKILAREPMFRPPDRAAWSTNDTKHIMGKESFEDEWPAIGEVSTGAKTKGASESITVAPDAEAGHKPAVASKKPHELKAVGAKKSSGSTASSDNGWRRVERTRPKKNVGRQRYRRRRPTRPSEKAERERRKADKKKRSDHMRAVQEQRYSAKAYIHNGSRGAPLSSCRHNVSMRAMRVASQDEVKLPPCISLMRWVFNPAAKSDELMEKYITECVEHDLHVTGGQEALEDELYVKSINCLRDRYQEVWNDKGLSMPNGERRMLTYKEFYGGITRKKSRAR